MVITLLAGWHVDVVPPFILNITDLLIPDDEDLFGDCMIIKSTGAYNIIERLTSMEYVCENTCTDAMTKDMDSEVTCQFESALMSWEKTLEDIKP